MKRAATFVLGTCAFECGMATNNANQVSLAIELFKDMVWNTHKDKYFTIDVKEETKILPSQILNIANQIRSTLALTLS